MGESTGLPPSTRILQESNEGTIIGHMANHGNLSQIDNYHYDRSTNVDLQSLREWLSPLDFSGTHEQLRDEVASDTGQWFLDSDQFKSWSNKQTTTTNLWCSGKPGAGKSSLASIVVEKFKNQKNSPFAFLYLAYKEKQETELSVPNLLGCLANQLIDQLDHNAPLPPCGERPSGRVATPGITVEHHLKILLGKRRSRLNYAYFSRVAFLYQHHRLEKVSIVEGRRSALPYAANIGSAALIDYYYHLQSGDFDFKNNPMYTALRIAVFHCDIDATKALLALGAGSDLTENNTYEALADISSKCEEIFGSIVSSMRESWETKKAMMDAARPKRCETALFQIMDWFSDRLLLFNSFEDATDDSGRGGSTIEPDPLNFAAERGSLNLYPYFTLLEACQRGDAATIQALAKGRLVDPRSIRLEGKAVTEMAEDMQIRAQFSWTCSYISLFQRHREASEALENCGIKFRPVSLGSYLKGDEAVDSTLYW
ncbi:hypothetical protein HDK64DRAFT_253725 [Phyllosticta capitalensis]